MAQIDDLKASIDQLNQAQADESNALSSALTDLLSAVQSGAPDLSLEIQAVKQAAQRAATNAQQARSADPGARPTGPTGV